MFELTFLGTAAAAPSAERGLPALLVAAGPRRLLIDCGEGTQRQLLRAGLGFRGLSHVLLTHSDLDHVLGLAGLVATLSLYGLGGGLEIVGSGDTIAFVRRYLAATVGGEESGAYRLRAVAPGRILSAPGWHLDAFAVGHRAAARASCSPTAGGSRRRWCRGRAAAAPSSQLSATRRRPKRSSKRCAAPTCSSSRRRFLSATPRWRASAGTSRRPRRPGWPAPPGSARWSSTTSPAATRPRRLPRKPPRSSPRPGSPPISTASWSRPGRRGARVEPGRIALS